MFNPRKRPMRDGNVIRLAETYESCELLHSTLVDGIPLNPSSEIIHGTCLKLLPNETMVYV